MAEGLGWGSPGLHRTGALAFSLLPASAVMVGWKHIEKSWVDRVKTLAYGGRSGPECLEWNAFIYLLIYSFIYFRAANAAYGSSQARGWIVATAAGLCHSHSNVESKQHLRLTSQVTAMWDPLTHWARPGIEPMSPWVLVGFVTHWATTGTPGTMLLKLGFKYNLGDFLIRTMRQQGRQKNK